MPTAHNLSQGTRSSAVLALGTLASGTYVCSSAIDFGANALPLSATFEIELNPNGTPSGNKQLMLFAKWSLDNTNFGSGPESGTTTTEEADLDLIGVCPCNDTNDHRVLISVAPKSRYFKLVAKNDLGVALTSGNVYRADITGYSA